MATRQGDPYPAYCFRVDLQLSDKQASMYFRKVSGLSYETEVTDYQEGGQNRFCHRLVGATKWSNLILERGFSQSDALIRWREEWTGGRGKRIEVGYIVQLDTELRDVALWTFHSGWPCKWELSAFDASKSELAIETLEIAHHGLEFRQIKEPAHRL